MRGRLADLVPAHVGHLEPAPGRGVSGREAGDPAAERSETPRAAVLLALLHERLEADADAEEGLLPDRALHAWFEAVGGKLGHAVPDRALAGEDDPVRGCDPLRIGGDQHVDRVAAHVPDRLLDGAQVPHAEVDDRDLLHGTGAPVSPGRLPVRPRFAAQSTPFVEGMAPARRSSRATAMRSARPNALNIVSAMWWALRPSRLSICNVVHAVLANP